MRLFRYSLSSLLALSLLGLGAAQAAELAMGPMVGDTDSQQSLIWLKTTGPAQVQIRYWPKGQPDLAQTSAAVTTSDQNWNTAKVPLTGLQPGWEYRYEVLVDQQPAVHKESFGFHTMPLFQGPDLPDVKILIGSCYYLDDPLLQMINFSYGSGMQIFENMVKYPSDMMFWLGDNVYFAPFDLSSLYNMNRRYEYHRRPPFLAPLFASMPHYATWDDHDFGPNNANTLFWRKEDSLNIFKAYWANPRFGLLSTPGVFFAKNWGDIDFFVLDDRYHRDPNDFEDRQARNYLGKPQLDWLKTQLLASKATFKLIMVGSPVLNQSYNESFMQAEGEYNALLKFLDEQRINGVLFITGDRHHTDLRKLQRKGAYPLYDFTNSPLTSTPTRILSKAEANDPLRVPGTLVMKHNFGRLLISGPAGARKLVMETRAEDGKLLWAYTISEAELRYPPSSPAAANPPATTP